MGFGLSASASRFLCLLQYSHCTSSLHIFRFVRIAFGAHGYQLSAWVILEAPSQQQIILPHHELSLLKSRFHCLWSEYCKPPEKR